MVELVVPVDRINDRIAVVPGKTNVRRLDKDLGVSVGTTADAVQDNRSAIDKGGPRGARSRNGKKRHAGIWEAAVQIPKQSEAETTIRRVWMRM